ncbi:uncharacterized protein AruCF_2001 [Achromobacter ruhlandii]|nr:uncharacterized protein AruCF_2001 [Achromobacter ruhlandii]
MGYTHVTDRYVNWFANGTYRLVTPSRGIFDVPVFRAAGLAGRSQ